MIGIALANIVSLIRLCLINLYEQLEIPQEIWFAL
jgi:hypothetical protein